MKKCIYCKQIKDYENFPKHTHSKDNLDNRCRECIKHNSDIRKKLYTKAPAKPELCECCKKIPAKWCLDHDHCDDSFRGWLCDRCNTGIGNLGDNLEGVVKAMNYFLSRNKIL